MCVCSVRSGHWQAGTVPCQVSGKNLAFENRVSGSGVTRWGGQCWAGESRSPPACRGWCPHRLPGIRQLPGQGGWRVSPCPCCWGACRAQAEVRGAIGCGMARPRCCDQEQQGQRPRESGPSLLPSAVPPAQACLCCCPHPAGLHPQAGTYVLGAFLSRPRSRAQSVGVLAHLPSAQPPAPGSSCSLGMRRGPRAAPALGQSRSCFWISGPCLPTPHPPLSPGWVPGPGPA